MQEIEEEKRDSFLLLNDTVREIILSRQYQIPFLKLAAYEGAV